MTKFRGTSTSSGRSRVARRGPSSDLPGSSPPETNRPEGMEHSHDTGHSQGRPCRSSLASKGWFSRHMRWQDPSFKDTGTAQQKESEVKRQRTAAKSKNADTEPKAKRHRISSKLKKAEYQISVEKEMFQTKQTEVTKEPTTSIPVEEGKFVIKVQNIMSQSRPRKTGPTKGITTEQSLPETKNNSELKMKPSEVSNTKEVSVKTRIPEILKSGTGTVKLKGKKVISKEENATSGKKTVKQKRKKAISLISKTTNDGGRGSDIEMESYNAYSTKSLKPQIKAQHDRFLYANYTISENSIMKFDSLCDPDVLRTDDSESRLKDAKSVIADLKKSHKQLLKNNFPVSARRKEYAKIFKGLIKNCKDTLDMILSYKTSEESNVLLTKSDETERIRAYIASNSGNANTQIKVSPHIFNSPSDGIKKLTSNKSWSRFEEVILIGVVFDRLFARGSLTNSCPELTGSTKSKGNPYYTWNEITEQYNNSLKRFKGGNHPDRTSVALMRHYKVMKHRLRKDVPDYTSVGSFRQLYREYESLNLTNKGDASREGVVHVCDEHGVARHIPVSDYFGNSNSSSARKKHSIFVGKKYNILLRSLDKLKKQRHAFMDQLKEKCQSKQKRVAEAAQNLLNFNNGAKGSLKISDEYTRRSQENASTQYVPMKAVDRDHNRETNIGSQSSVPAATATAATLATQEKQNLSFHPKAKQQRSQLNYGDTKVQETDHQASLQQMQMYHQSQANQQINQQQMQMQKLAQQQMQGMGQVHMAHQMSAQMAQQMMYPQLGPAPMHYPMAPMPIYVIPAMQAQHVQTHMQRMQVSQTNNSPVLSHPNTPMNE